MINFRELEQRILAHRTELIAAAKRLDWKHKLAEKYRAIFPVDPRIKQDRRNIDDFAYLLIDPKGATEAEREQDFKVQFEKLVKAFGTPGENPAKPDPEAIKPYLKQMYEKVRLDENINWNDPSQVEELFATMRISQALATAAKDFRKEVFELYPTHEQIRRFDAKISNAYMVGLKLSLPLMNTGVNRDVSEYINVGRGLTVTPGRELEAIIHSAANDATLSGDDVIRFDATENACMQDHFLGKDFSVEVFTEIINERGEYTEHNYKRDFAEFLSSCFGSTVFEQMSIGAMKDHSDEGYETSNLLFINGKSMAQITDELREKEGISAYDARTRFADMLRDALTDGKSIVGVMRMSCTPDGEAKFRHQEVKVDLDKLNAADRKENDHKYGRFRKFLDRIGLWKIQKFPTNAERDKKQAKMRQTKKFSNALKAAEKNFVRVYNTLSPSTDVDDIVNFIPKLRVAETEIRQAEPKTAEISTDRVPIPNLQAEIEKPAKNTEIEPPKQISVPTKDMNAVSK